MMLKKQICSLKNATSVRIDKNKSVLIHQKYVRIYESNFLKKIILKIYYLDIPANFKYSIMNIWAFTLKRVQKILSSKS